MEIRNRLLRWLRNFLLHQLQEEWKHLAKWYKLDEQEIYDAGRWTGLLNTLDENSPLVKKTFREVINWYLYGMNYVRAYARGRKDQRKDDKNT